MFNMKIAKVGVGVNAETMDMEKYELDKLTIWDTPGRRNLGLGKGCSTS
jgi:predicted GTPase